MSQLRDMGTRLTESFAEGDRWYLLTSRPRMEGRVIAHLDRLGLSWLAPMLPVERWVSGKRLMREERMFPRYVFVQADFARTPFGHLQYLQGVSGFVRRAGQLLQVPDAVMRSLRGRVSPEYGAVAPLVARFSRGDRVRLTGGGFADVQAIYLQPDGERRSVLLIEMLGRGVETRVGNRFLAAP